MILICPFGLWAPSQGWAHVKIQGLGYVQSSYRSRPPRTDFDTKVPIPTLGPKPKRTPEDTFYPNMSVLALGPKPRAGTCEDSGFGLVPFPYGPRPPPTDFDTKAPILTLGPKPKRTPEDTFVSSGVRFGFGPQTKGGHMRRFRGWIKSNFPMVQSRHPQISTLRCQS